MSRTISIRGRWAASAIAAVVLWSAAPAAAQQSPAVQRGLTFVRVHCAQCHATDTVSESTLKIAPPFRDLHLKYPVESLQRPLSEGIIANHPTMPQFRLDADQINDVIAFMKSLEH
jgi:cytochrome c